MPKIKKKYESGSFRDPEGRIFYFGDRIFRQFTKDGYSQFLKFFQNPLFRALLEEKIIIPTYCIDKSSFHDLSDIEGEVVEHERIPFISYSYEWTPSMLRDAGLLVLELQKRLLACDYSLKDATPYNVQFKNGKPIWIDIASIQHWDGKPAWVAYSQFCRFYLYPLLLRKFAKIGINRLLLAELEGVDFEETVKMLPVRVMLDPRFFWDVALPSILQKFIKERFSADIIRSRNKSSPYAKKIQQKTLKRLSNLIRGLVGEEESLWSRYQESDICNYSKNALRQKEEFVKECLREAQSRNILDVGCNTGFYSLAGSKILPAGQIVSIDNDTESVEQLYKTLKGEKILPLVLDVTNSSPALGWRSLERKSFLERADFDCILALAIIHHLRVTKNLPLKEIAEFFYSLTSRYLIIEFVDKNDMMFQKLVAIREDIYHDYSISSFENIFSKFFRLRKKLLLDGQTRTLYFLKKI